MGKVIEKTCTEATSDLYATDQNTVERNVKSLPMSNEHSIKTANGAISLNGLNSNALKGFIGISNINSFNFRTNTIENKFSDAKTATPITKHYLDFVSMALVVVFLKGPTIFSSGMS